MSTLTGVAKDIFSDVLAAMQNAEELGGPEGEDYRSLMDAISEEALKRKAASEDAKEQRERQKGAP